MSILTSKQSTCVALQSNTAVDLMRSEGTVPMCVVHGCWRSHCHSSEYMRIKRANLSWRNEVMMRCTVLHIHGIHRLC